MLAFNIIILIIQDVEFIHFSMKRRHFFTVDLFFK